MKKWRRTIGKNYTKRNFVATRVKCGCCREPEEESKTSILVGRVFGAEGWEMHSVHYVDYVYSNIWSTVYVDIANNKETGEEMAGNGTCRDTRPKGEGRHLVT